MNILIELRIYELKLKFAKIQNLVVTSVTENKPAGWGFPPFSITLD